MAGDYLFLPEGIKGESSDRVVHPSLALLVARLRQCMKGHVLTSVAHGARSPARDGVQGRLRLLGVFERPATGAGAAWAGAPSCIVVQAEGPAAGRAKPIPVLMVIADHRDFSRVPMAEKQQLRDAQRHLDLPASCRIVVGTGAPAAAGDHEKWIELTHMGL